MVPQFQAFCAQVVSVGCSGSSWSAAFRMSSSIAEKIKLLMCCFGRQQRPAISVVCLFALMMFIFLIFNAKLRKFSDMANSEMLKNVKICPSWGLSFFGLGTASLPPCSHPWVGNSFLIIRAREGKFPTWAAILSVCNCQIVRILCLVMSKILRIFAS